MPGESESNLERRVGGAGDSLDILRTDFRF